MYIISHILPNTKNDGAQIYQWASERPLLFKILNTFKKMDPINIKIIHTKHNIIKFPIQIFIYTKSYRMAYMHTHSQTFQINTLNVHDASASDKNKQTLTQIRSIYTPHINEIGRLQSLSLYQYKITVRFWACY